MNQEWQKFENSDLVPKKITKRLPADQAVQRSLQVVLIRIWPLIIKIAWLQDKFRTLWPRNAPWVRFPDPLSFGFKTTSLKPQYFETVLFHFFQIKMHSSKYAKRLGKTVPYEFFECTIIRNMFYTTYRTKKSLSQAKCFILWYSW